MNKVAAALKVNILSLLCIPILLLSIFFYMIGTAMRKMSIIVMSVFAFVVVIIISAVLSEPSQIWTMILMLFIIFVVLGVITAIIIACIRIITAILISVSDGLSFVFLSVGEFLKDLFLSMIDRIRGIMQTAEVNEKNKGFSLACFMFFLMNGFYHLIVKILKYSYLYAGIGCIAILVALYLKFNAAVMDVMGISLVKYIKLFHLLDIILCALILITVLACSFMIIVTFGFEWSELAINIEQSGNYRYIDSCFDNSIETDFNLLQDRLIQAGNYRLNVMQRAQEIFQQNLGTRELEHVFNENNSIWADNLDKIIKFMEDSSSGPNEEKQATLYWRIDNLLRELENANRDVEDEINQAVRKNNKNQYENNEDPEQKKQKTFEIHFFMGCKDLNSLEERRKKLAKIYHPDTETGDTQSFQVMMSEYEELKKSL